MLSHAADEELRAAAIARGPAAVIEHVRRLLAESPRVPGTEHRKRIRFVDDPPDGDTP